MIELRTLGGVEVSEQGRSVRLGPRKETALLVRLALAAGAAVPRACLVALLWEHAPEARGRRSLSQALYSLSRRLPSLAVRRCGDAVAVDASGLWMDLVEHRAAARAARLSRAAALWRGDFLAGFWIRDAPAFEEWREAVATEARRDAERVWRGAIDAREADGDWAGVVEAADRLLGLDPYDEDVHRIRLRALAAGGERAFAAREVARLKAFMARELGRDLGPETRAVARLLDRSGPGADAPRAPEEATAPFVGRGAEMRRLRGLWIRARQGRGGAALVVGAPGMGKTRLCTRLARLAILQGGRVLRGRCHEAERVLPYGGLSDALAAGVPPSEAQALSEPWRCALAGLVPELTGERGSGDPASPASRPLFEAVRRLLHGMSRAAPVVLFLDDIHWAHPSTVALVHYLVRRAAASRVLILLAARPADPPAGSFGSGLCRDRLLRIELSPLDGASARELLERCARTHDLTLSGAERRRTIERAAGRPGDLVEAVAELRRHAR